MAFKGISYEGWIGVMWLNSYWRRTPVNTTGNFRVPQTAAKFFASCVIVGVSRSILLHADDWIRRKVGTELLAFPSDRSRTDSRASCSDVAPSDSQRSCLGKDEVSFGEQAPGLFAPPLQQLRNMA